MRAQHNLTFLCILYLLNVALFYMLRSREMSFRTVKLKILGTDIECFSIVDYKYS